MTAKKNNLPKFHVKMYSNIDSLSLEEYKGLIYTSGFEKGSDGYILNAINNEITMLKVNRSARYSIHDADKVPEIPMLNRDEYLVSEFIYKNDIYLVWFKKVEPEDPDRIITLPAHELVSIS